MVNTEEMTSIYLTIQLHCHNYLSDKYMVEVIKAFPNILKRR